MFGLQCQNKVGCWCENTRFGSECTVKQCYSYVPAKDPTNEDFALCNVDASKTFAFTPQPIGEFHIRSPLRIVVASLFAGASPSRGTVRVKADGCSTSEMAQLAQRLTFTTASDGALLVDVGAFMSRNENTTQCDSLTRVRAEAAAAQEAEKDRNCPWRLQPDYNCTVAGTDPAPPTTTSTTIAPTPPTMSIVLGETITTTSYTGVTETTNPTREAIESASSAIATTSYTGTKAPTHTTTNPTPEATESASSAIAVSPTLMCAATVAATAMNRAPWHVSAAIGVAGLLATANAQQTPTPSTCDVWIEVAVYVKFPIAMVREYRVGDNFRLVFELVVTGRPFVDNRGALVVSGVERQSDNRTTAPNSAIGARKSDSGSSLTSALIAAASAELAATPDDAETWLMQATAEHASVASFAQFTLNLMANAAPSPLLAASLRAAQDEVLHADACLAMARASSNTGASFEAFPASAIDGMRAQSLRDLALATLREGGIAELMSTLDAVAHVGEAASRGHVNVADVWRAIASDESRHALLAWRTLAWAVRREPSLVELLAREIDDVAASVAANPRHVATLERVVKPMFACVCRTEGATVDYFDDASIDERVTAMLNALERRAFSVDAVMTTLRDVMMC